MLLFLCFIWHNAAYFLPTFLLFSVFFHNPFYFLKYFTKLFSCLVLPPHIMGNAPSFTLGGKSIVPFQYAFSTHGHNLSAAFRQHHYKCVFDTWCFLRQGLLQRNDVADIITISGAATIFICLRQGLLQRNDVTDIITITKTAATHTEETYVHDVCYPQKNSFNILLLQIRFSLLL